jgi:WD40 repeat protein
VQAARKFDAFCVDPRELWAFVGDFSGRISVIDIDRFEVLSEAQAHAGTVSAMSASPSIPYFASMSIDLTVAVWRYDERGRLQPIAMASTRHVRPSNDREDVGYVHSQSQSLGFHSSKRRIVTRSGNAGVLELEFEDSGAISVLRCTRMHDHWDPVTTRYVADSDRVLSGDAGGYIVLSENGEILRRWRLREEGIHWLEHLGGTEYLVGSDARIVARLDIERDEIVAETEPFARDDVEQVTYNKTSNKAYVASFDRQIYEIDPATCRPQRIAYRPPYKCRWIKALNRDPSRLLLQVRDGGLHKVNLDTGKAEVVIKRTPPALWSGVTRADGTILLAGEGEELLRLKSVGVEPLSLSRVFATSRHPVDISRQGYTKRIEIQPATGRVVFGRTNGHLYELGGDGSTRLIVELSGPIRDVALAPDRPEAFVACEDSRAHRVDLDTGRILATFVSPNQLPIWTLAFNPAKNLLAVMERWGKVWLLSGTDLTVAVEGDFNCKRAKRAKWCDDERLFFSSTGEMQEIDLRTGKQRAITEFLKNTIEDFIWDPGRSYLVMIVYTGMICLHDFHSHQQLAEVRDQIDYSKGIMWVPPRREYPSYPLDFITYGRSGTAHMFRIHNENLVALGPVGPGLGDPRLGA